MEILGFKIRLEFKIEDFWIGIFFRKISLLEEFGQFDIWICLVPTIPIHVRIFFLKNWKLAYKNIGSDFYKIMVKSISWK